MGEIHFQEQPDNMKIKRLLLYVCFCGLLSCGHKDTGVKQEAITFQRVPIDGLLIGRANGMMIKGNNLLIADAMSDAIFYWIQLDKGTFQKVGSMGQGPDEYLRFETFYQTNGQCGFYDSRLWRCVDVTMDVSAFCVSENDKTLYVIGLADDYELFKCNIEI